jgi:hypothetical protein
MSAWERVHARYLEVRRMEGYDIYKLLRNEKQIRDDGLLGCDTM